MSEALITSAIVITGSASEVSAAPGFAQSSRGKPPEGSQRRFTAKTLTSSIPTQKTGTAMPSWEKPESRMPYQRSARTAAMKPAGRAISRARAKESSVSGMVTLMRAAISGPTGSELMKELPRSRLSTPPNQSVNCWNSGRSAPTWARAASICSWVAFTDSRALAGSPGSTRSNRKSTTIAIAKEITRKPRRRTR